MNFDGLTMKLLTKELKSICEHSQIQKILQIDKLTLLLRLSTNFGIQDLIITMGNRPSCYITSPLKDLPKEPSTLCMFLRKHYEGARITKVEQIQDDRIIHITVDKLDLAGSIETKHIYIELMGKYRNCIFVEDEIILESLIHVTPFMSQERQIQAKLPYQFPPNTERMCVGDFDPQTILQMLTMDTNIELITAIRHLFNGFGNPLIKELEFRTKVSTKTLIKDLTLENLLNFSENLLSLYKEIDSSKTLYYYELKTGKKIYSPITLNYLNVEPITYNQISPLLEKETYDNGSINTTKHQLETILKSAIKKELRRLRKIEKEFDETKRMDLYKKYADLLMIYAYMPHKYENSIEVVDCLDESQSNITIDLKPELTISQNGQAYYKRYNRLKNRLFHSKEQIEQSKSKISYLESILFSLQTVNDKQELLEIKSECQEYGLIKKAPRHMRQKENTPTPLIITTENGHIIIGRNNKQNEQLTHRTGQPNDLWFHAQNIQGSHVLLQSNFEPIESDIKLAAAYAAYFSKSREGANVPVDFTLLKYVKKVPNTPLGFVTYKNQSTIYVMPQKPILNSKD